jgi:hypothetical protein
VQPGISLCRRRIKEEIGSAPYGIKALEGFPVAGHLIKNRIML